MISEPETLPRRGEFRLRLQAELLRRIKGNPQYSLRAFARALQIDASTLSQYLRGRRPLSLKNVEVFGRKIGLSPEELGEFTRKITVRGSIAEKNWEEKNNDLTIDVFRAIADWYHYAIFELVTLKEFRRDSRWIAKKLNISASDAEFAVERLLRIGLLTEGPSQKLNQGALNISTTGNSFTAVAFRKLQSQILEKAIVALEDIPMSERDQSSMTIAMSRKQLEKAKAKIKTFRREFCDSLQREARSRDAVYHLSISFYPVTKINELKKSPIKSRPKSER